MILTIILSVIYGIANALHDIPAINNFTNFGSTPKEQRAFHWNNALMKICFAIIVAMQGGWLFFIVSGLCIWTVFDPVIARFRQTKKVWYYLSEGNQTDRILLRLFGKNAGIYKTIINIILIIAIVIYEKSTAN